jgi:hypothetical protein
MSGTRFGAAFHSICVTLLMVSGCGENGDTAPDTAPPVLSVSPVSLGGPYDPGRDAYGDVTFSHRDAILPFGFEIRPGVYSCGFEYYTVVDAPVRAASGGVVVYMFQNEGLSDYEIHIRPGPRSVWDVQYDHVLGPTVQEGSRVSAGDVLGTSGEWSATIRRTELSVSQIEGPGTDVSYCPMAFATSLFAAEHQALLDAVNAHGFGPYDSLCLAEVCIP